MTRQQHLDWAKARAFAFCDRGEWQEGWTSVLSDLLKHPQLQDHSGIRLATMMIAGGHLRSGAEMRKFIEGFN